MNTSTDYTFPKGKVPPLLRNLVQQYPPEDVYCLTPSIIDFQTNQLYGPWARLAEKYEADGDTVIKGLFGVNLRKAYTTWPTDRPIPKIAVMVKGLEREETYLPGITPHFVRFTDATGDMLASVQEAACQTYPMILDEHTVIVLQDVPIFHRSRFNKTFLVGKSCICDIFPEYKEDRTVTISSQETQIWTDAQLTQHQQYALQAIDRETYHVDQKPELQEPTSSTTTTTSSSSSSSTTTTTSSSSSSSITDTPSEPIHQSASTAPAVQFEHYRIRRSRHGFYSLDEIDPLDEDDDDADTRQ